MTQRVLVTGGAGFIGSHLVDRLLADGLFTVDVLDNFDPFYARQIKLDNIAAHLTDPRYRLIQADLRDGPDALAERLRPDGYDTIVHLAARAGVRPSLEDPRGYREVNVTGTATVLELARRWQVPHLVVASSSSVYGTNPHVPWHEALELLPISPYAETKLATEDLCRDAAGPQRSIVALRFFTVYGPRQRPDLAIHKFARLMREGRPIPIFGAGDTRRDYTFIDDIIHGVRAAMDYRQTPFEIINLGNNQAVGLLELVRALERALGTRAILEHHPEQPGDVPQTWANVDKARRLLGYQPTTPIERGLERFAAWLAARPASVATPG